ncbi:MAG TPA: efflux RND transporter periplasmic adaptor subunit [Polyangiaceae bacterium]
MTTMSAAAPAVAKPVTRRPWRVARALRWVAVLVLIAATAIFAWRRLHATSTPQVRYQTAPVDHGAIDAKVTASGAVSAIVTVQVGSQVSGRIQAWYADFSSKVKKGQLIAKIEPSLFKAAVEQAQANYTAGKATYDKSIANRVLAERNYARTLALFEQALASRGDLDAAEAAAGAARADVGTADATMLQARAALDQARLNLSYTDIVSPIDGIVISRNIDAGQTVAASFQAPTLFTIAQDLTKMQVDTNVAEGDVGNVREGMAASFTVDAFPTRTFHGVVRQVRDNATTLQNVVTYDAVIDVDNGDLALRPTMTANVTFVYASRADAVRIPNAALRFRPDSSTIAAMTGPSAGPAPSRDGLAADQRLLWTLRAGAASPHVVRIGISDGMTTEMVDGDLRAGDVVVTEAIPGKGS